MDKKIKVHLSYTSPHIPIETRLYFSESILHVVKLAFYNFPQRLWLTEIKELSIEEGNKEDLELIYRFRYKEKSYLYF